MRLIDSTDSPNICIFLVPFCVTPNCGWCECFTICSCIRIFTHSHNVLQSKSQIAPFVPTLMLALNFNTSSSPLLLLYLYCELHMFIVSFFFFNLSLMFYFKWAFFMPLLVRTCFYTYILTVNTSSNSAPWSSKQRLKSGVNFFPVLFDHLIAFFSVVGNNRSIKKKKKTPFDFTVKSIKNNAMHHHK